MARATDRVSWDEQLVKHLIVLSLFTRYNNTTGLFTSKTTIVYVCMYHRTKLPVYPYIHAELSSLK